MLLYDSMGTKLPGARTHDLTEIRVRLILGLEPGESPMDHAQSWADVLSIMAAWSAAQFEMLRGRETLNASNAEDSKARMLMGTISDRLRVLRDELACKGSQAASEVTELIPQIQAAVALEGALQDAARILACQALKPKPDQAELQL